jgi:ATP-dependent RNA helicase DeaD
VAITLVEPREHHQLRNIERLTKHRIEIAKVPTVADLRAKRLELTRAALQEALVGDDNEHFRVVVDALSDEYDPIQIAMAAVKLYHQATVGDSEDDEEHSGPGSTTAADGARARAAESSSRAPRRVAGPGADEAPYGLVPAGEMTRIFVGAGRDAGIRPQDLVGAIANEAGVAGALIGAIQISDRFSLVEVPGDVAEQVVKALGKTKLRGRKVLVKVDRGR